MPRINGNRPKTNQDIRTKKQIREAHEKIHEYRDESISKHWWWVIG